MYPDQNYPFENNQNEELQNRNAHNENIHTESIREVNSPVSTAKPVKKVTRPSLPARILGKMLGGLLFGFCAGIAIIIVLRLFPKEVQNVIGQLEKPKVEIQQAQRVNEDKVIGDAPEDASGAEESGTKAEKNEATAEAEEQENADETAIEQTVAEDGKPLFSQNLAVVTDVTKVVDSVMPSVVSIFGTYMITENYWGFQMRQEEEGSGSGIIVGENDEELLIVTNNHVVADSTSLSVQFIDDETYPAVVKGTSPDEDLAVIAIDLVDISDDTKAAIKIATLGDSDSLTVGEPAIAIGNALGYGQSVTTGVISAVNRKYSMDENGKTSYLIQTDAAINPGNSGGALLNVYGEVIGINSNKIAGSTIEGMGYAIPISTARPILEELMSKKTRVPVGENKKGYLGISGINVTEEVQDTYGLPLGVYIAQVFDGTPASRAGLEKGYIIQEFDEEKVETMEQLTHLLDCTQEGTTVEMKIMVPENGEYVEKTYRIRLEGRY